MHYGQLTYAHAQAEVPSYELYAGNTKISTDQGTIDYASPFHERYFRRAVAHNVPLIDGEGQELDRWTWLEGCLERFSPRQASISVTQPAHQKGVDVGRQITLQGNIFVDSTRINVTNGTKRRLGIVFNTDCQFDATGGLASLTPTSAPLGTGFEYWKDVLKGSAPALWSTTLDCSGEKFNFQVTASKPHQLYRALAPATPMPKTRNAIYMEMQDSEATY
ncbi:MAG: heparinase II/III family protein [Burkholderiales bacterium]|nr:heparinase II/III family protein [Burkholderiales bacterium]